MLAEVINDGTGISIGLLVMVLGGLAGIFVTLFGLWRKVEIANINTLNGLNETRRSLNRLARATWTRRDQEQFALTLRVMNPEIQVPPFPSRGAENRPDEDLDDVEDTKEGDT